ncbi:MAG: hypothetical protein AAF108_07120 [Planctomycetota bacterium]
MPSERPPDILFTAFEPSGDDEAASVIRALRERYPGVRIAAWGGPRMRDAGAEIIELTGADPVMGIPGPSKIREHLSINRRIERWLASHSVRVHVPVDSPAANFPICAIAKKRGIKVVHLVAPQVWAWGSWRVGKLRRSTDLVLCLLPFEESFFNERGIRAEFIGHHLFDDYRGPDEPFSTAKLREIDHQAAGFIDGSPRVALLPGSRAKEHHANFPILLETFQALRSEFPGLAGVVASLGPSATDRLRDIADAGRGWPDELDLAEAQTDAVIRWCDVALVVSGTVTLQVARQQRPMIVVYKTGKLFYNIVGKRLVSTPFFTLPNLIAGREVVPELVPHFGGHEPLLERARTLLETTDAADRQRAELGEVVDRFLGRASAVNAADAIARVAGLGPLREEPSSETPGLDD